MTAVAPTAVRAVLLTVTGVVQGVGFRPFVHRLAARRDLRGWVRNTSGCVEIALEGEGGSIDSFTAALRAEAPPLARIDLVRATPMPALGLAGFEIAGSASAAGERLPVSPDVAVCAGCEAELYDVHDRRHQYPFITCTDCGPRHSVIEAMPYDRERTSMRVFAQCPACRREYRSLGDRRYHSETNSCPVCGPRVRFERQDGGAGDALLDGDAIAAAAVALRAGEIVAIRGIGGFHLAVDATNEPAVALLRERKHRDGKPLAVMVRSLADARALARVSDAEARWLAGAERPIVVLAAHPRGEGGVRVAPSVSNGLASLGVMLAYAPLQMLLLDAVDRPLVMTSGNHGGEPLTAGVNEAHHTLGRIADAFLVHDREIVARVDDSVMRVAGDVPVLLRRARGFAPLPVTLPVAAPAPILATGAHLKNTFALAAGRDVYVSQHIGDLETLEMCDHWRATERSFRALFDIEPRVAACDLHPDYLSTRLAEERVVDEVVRVQHHHAHIAAVAAEWGITRPVLGVAFDGTGLGDDGRIWGAEFLVADLEDSVRVGQLRYAPLPGGDLAARTPWRAAAGYLALDPSARPAFARAFDHVDRQALELAELQVARGLNAPEASSMGRLFDAAAAVLGVCRVSRFEGEAAMRLESLAVGHRGAELPFDAEEGTDGRWRLDPLPLLVALGERAARGHDAGELAAAFHESVAAGTAALASYLAESRGLREVALGGGVFQNARLLTSLRARLRARGLRVLVARQLPPNDGGISYGQAAVAAARLAARG